MSAHTPGPWAILTPSEDWLGRPVHDWAVTVHEHDDWICTGPTWDQEFHDESLANARLIAAAPEMLDALRDVIEHMEWSTTRGEAAYQCARAAIAKATGGAA